MTSFFAHHHWWRTSETHGAVKPSSPVDHPTPVLVFQQCGCGAVRTIEYSLGKAPVIRMGVEAIWEVDV